MSERDDVVAVRSDLAQLIAAYALALDSRNVSMMAGLWSARSYFGDVHGRGQAGAAAFYTREFRSFRRSMHLVGNQHVEWAGGDEARGTVYCQGIHETHEGPWEVQLIAYRDRYVVDDDRWVFLGRRAMSWGTVRDLRISEPDHLPALPDQWPTWAAFWADGGAGS